jgi:hypothetical protein
LQLQSAHVLVVSNLASTASTCRHELQWLVTLQADVPVEWRVAASICRHELQWLVTLQADIHVDICFWKPIGQNLKHLLPVSICRHTSGFHTYRDVNIGKQMFELLLFHVLLGTLQHESSPLLRRRFVEIRPCRRFCR